MNFSRLTRNFSFEFNQIKLSHIENLNFTFRIRCFSPGIVVASLSGSPSGGTISRNVQR